MAMADSASPLLYKVQLPSSFLMEPNVTSTISGPMLQAGQCELWCKAMPFPRLVSGLGKRKVHDSEPLDLMGSLLEGVWEHILQKTG